MDPFSLYGGITTGLGLLGAGISAFGGRSGPQTESDFNVDPDNYAMKRSRELLDPTSRPNMFALSRFGKLARDSAPTADTLFSFARGQGIGTMGAGVISTRQNEANASKGREAAMGGYMDYLSGSEKNAQGWAGMSFDNSRYAKTSAAGVAGEKQGMQASFFNETAKVGMGFLNYGMNQNKPKTQNGVPPNQWKLASDLSMTNWGGY